MRGARPQPPPPPVASYVNYTSVKSLDYFIVCLFRREFLFNEMEQRAAIQCGISSLLSSD